MKKALAMILSCAFALSFVACGSSTSEASSSNTPLAPAPTSEPVAESIPEQPSVEVLNESLHTYTDSLGSTNAIYMCEIKNTGTKSVKISNISIDVDDANGTLLTTANLVSSYPNVIAADESAFVCEQVINGAFDTDIDASTAAAATLHYTIDEREVPEVSAEVTQVSLGDKMGYPNLTGKVKNTGSEDLTMLYISAPVYDADGNLQTVIFTVISELKVGEEKGFEQMAIACDIGLDYSGSTLGQVSVYNGLVF